MASASGRSVLALFKEPLLAAGRTYNAHAQRRPLATGVITTVVKTSAADLFAQTVMEGKDWKDIDWKRHGVFCSFGLFYLGGFQYYLYNHLFVRMCAGVTEKLGHVGAAPIKVFIDQAIHHPLCYFPVFYLVKGAAEGRPVKSTMEKYRRELWDNLKALWTIWVPAQMVNFTLVPRHLRIPYVAGVSFLWTIVISVMRGALEPAAPTVQQIDDAVAAVAAAAASATASAAAATAAAAAPIALAEAPAAAAGGGGGGGGGAMSGRSSSSSSSCVAARGPVGPAGAGFGLKALISD